MGIQHLDNKGFPLTMRGIVERARALPKRSVVVAGSADQSTLTAVRGGINENIIGTVHLVGNQSRTESVLTSEGIDLGRADIKFYNVVTNSQEVADLAVNVAAETQADLLMKGGIPTNVLMKPVVTRGSLLRVEGSTVSWSTIFELPEPEKRIAVFADPGIPLKVFDGTVLNEVKTRERMADAIWNAVLVARQVLGIEEPKVAVMSFTEIMIDSSGVCFAKKLADYTRSKYSEDNIPFLIEGPLSYDVAVSMLSARNKGAGNRPVAGRADVLFFPEIDASNVLYKVWQVSGFPTASVILGARKPMALVSRSDPAETKLSTIAACSCYLGDVKKE